MQQVLQKQRQNNALEAPPITPVTRNTNNSLQENTVTRATNHTVTNKQKLFREKHKMCVSMSYSNEAQQQLPEPGAKTAIPRSEFRTRTAACMENGLY